MNTLGKIFIVSLLACASAGCGRQRERPAAVPCHFSQQSYERICKHPSMTAAAWREAYACHGHRPPPRAALALARR